MDRYSERVTIIYIYLIEAYESDFSDEVHILQAAGRLLAISWAISTEVCFPTFTYVACSCSMELLIYVSSVLRNAFSYFDCIISFRMYSSNKNFAKLYLNTMLVTLVLSGSICCSTFWIICLIWLVRWVLTFLECSNNGLSFCINSLTLATINITGSTVVTWYFKNLKIVYGKMGNGTTIDLAVFSSVTKVSKNLRLEASITIAFTCTAVGHCIFQNTLGHWPVLQCIITARKFKHHLSSGALFLPKNILAMFYCDFWIGCFCTQTSKAFIIARSQKLQIPRNLSKSADRSTLPASARSSLFFIIAALPLPCCLALFCIDLVYHCAACFPVASWNLFSSKYTVAPSISFNSWLTFACIVVTLHLSLK